MHLAAPIYCAYPEADDRSQLDQCWGGINYRRANPHYGRYRTRYRVWRIGSDTRFVLIISNHFYGTSLTTTFLL